MATQLDISVPNLIVYDGVKGDGDSVEVIRQNVKNYLTRVGERHSVTLTGDAPLLVYLAIFGVLCSIVERVYWMDGQGKKSLVFTAGWVDSKNPLNTGEGVLKGF